MIRFLSHNIKILFLSTIWLLTACGSTAQTVSSPNSGNVIVIDATGSAVAPVDQIFFNITINLFNEQAEQAFEDHKNRERYLTDLLLDQNFNKEDINANPISISPRRYSNERGYETNQSISIKLDDILEFERMQIEFIKNGFDNFSGRFGSSQSESAKHEALKNAIDEAKNSAATLANAANRTVGKIINIEYSSTSRPIFREASNLVMSAAPADGGMMQFQTTLEVTQNVRVTFELVN